MDNTENIKPPGTPPVALQRACYAALVEKLLDAAFHELQHDTGPQDPEWVSQRKNLKAAFKRVLRVRHNDRTERRGTATLENPKPL